MQSRTDEIIRETDFDALSSRLSAYLKGYLPTDTPLLLLIPLLIHYQLLSTSSEFTQFALSRRLKRVFFNLFPTNLKPISLSKEDSPKIQVSPFSSFKPPLINRGTYLRTATITKHITEILDKYPDEQIQIVSLGAGNDTRPFTLLPLYSNLKYFELDFDNTIKLKKLSILSSPKLSSLVNAKAYTVEELPSNLDDILKVSPDLHTSNYHLISLDLRNLKPDLNLSDIPGLKYLDQNKRTIVISECCICYLSKNDSNDLLSFWAKNLNKGEFLVYEPIGGINESNNYGDVMVKNLGGRGIEMPTLMLYNTTESQLERFKNLLVNCDKKNIWCKNMRWVYYNMVDANEINRISKLEMLDEMEELNLINSHYCLIIADWGRF